MQELKTIIEAQHGNGDDPSADLEDELMKLSRENLKLCEDIAAGIQGPADDEPSILGSLNILKALRQSSEADGAAYSAPPPRAATTAKAARNPKRKADALGSTGSAGSSAATTVGASVAASTAASASGVSTPGAASSSHHSLPAAPSEDRDVFAGPDSLPGTPMSASAASSTAGGTAASVAGGGGAPSSTTANAGGGPSPKVVAVPTANRLKAHSSSRAGSVPAAREASVKIEEGADSGAEALAKRECPLSSR